MMRPLTRTLVLTGFTLIAATLVVRAQSPVTFIVPFEFTVGSRALPAGTYAVTNLSDRNVLSLQNTVTQSRVLVPGHASYHGGLPGRGVLRFNRYDTAYFLSAAWLDEDAGTELPMGRAEREYLARRSATAGCTMEPCHSEPVSLVAAR